MISVIIPTHLRNADLARVLLALSKQSLAKTKFEVLVVSNLANASTEKMLEMWREVLPQLYYHASGSLGVNRARNLGIQESRGDILVFLDDDCLPPSGYLERVERLHSEYPEYTGIGGFYQARAQASALAQAYNQISVQWLQQSQIGARETTNLVGGNASYKAQSIRGAFRFDESILFGGAETEFNARLLGAGLRLAIFPDLDLEHRVRLNFRSFLRRAWLQGSSARLLALRGEVPQFRTYSGELPRFFLTTLFRMIFRLAGDYAEISLYEDRSARRPWLLVRHYWRNLRLSWRNSIFLREFGFLLAYYWRSENPSGDLRISKSK